MKLSIALMIVIIIACHNSSFGQKIYLSPAGNDSNPGSADKPLATLTAARDRAREYQEKQQ